LEGFKKLLTLEKVVNPGRKPYQGPNSVKGENPWKNKKKG